MSIILWNYIKFHPQREGFIKTCNLTVRSVSIIFSQSQTLQNYFSLTKQLIPHKKIIAYQNIERAQRTEGSFKLNHMFPPISSILRGIVRRCQGLSLTVNCFNCCNRHLPRVCLPACNTVQRPLCGSRATGDQRIETDALREHCDGWNTDSVNCSPELK